MKKLLGILSVLLILVGSASAQVVAGQGAVAGTVTDSTKAVVPGAKVVLDNKSIGYHKETVTNSGGGFTFSPLTVVEGYSLTISAKGFSTAVVANFATSVGTVIAQNVSLSVGAEGTTVEVAAGSVEQVQTDTSSISQLIDKTIWEESPLSIRDSNVFVGLVAGASSAAVSGRGYAVNGARSGTGNFQVEGADNNDQGQGGAATGGTPGGGGGVVTISPDAIQEYRVITSVPNAEYGRAGGFTTDTVLRSGTTTWHGSAFEYNRIQALAQNAWTSNHSGLRDHLVRNQFGGSIGGAIYKDRTFFFATAEFQRQRSSDSSKYTSITQDFYNFVKTGAYQKWMEGTGPQGSADPLNPGADPLGFCQEYLGTTCPGAFSDVATTGSVFNTLYAQAGTTQFPLGTLNQTRLATDLYLGGNFANPEVLPVNIYGDGYSLDGDVYNENRATFKLDHKLTNKDQLAFTYLADLGNETVQHRGGGGYPGGDSLNVGGAQLFTARWTHTFTPNILNEFKAGYTRHVRNFSSTAPFGVATEAAADNISVGFGSAGGYPQLFTENEFTYDDSVTWTRKTHTFKGGFHFIRTRNGSSFYNDVNGTIYYWGAPGLLTDAKNEIDAGALLDNTSRVPVAGVYQAGPAGGFQATFGGLYAFSASQDPSTGGAPDPYRGYRGNEFAGYVQDDWKVTPRLTFNYGLRWDYFGPPHNARPGLDSNVYFGSGTTVTLTNPFAPNSGLLAAMQGAAFKCVGYTPCGNAVLNPVNPAGYAAASGMSTIWDRDLNNFAPRLGFSYDVLGNGKIAIRGGFGMGYDRLYNNVYENIRFNGPHFVDNTLGYGEGAAGVPFTITAAAVTPTFHGNGLLSGANPVPRHVNQHLKTAYYENIHFGVETQLKKGYVLEVNYIGNLGRQLVGLMNANTFEGRVACSGAALTAKCNAAGLTTAAQRSTARPTALFGNDNFRTNGFTSNYNAAQVSLRKGFSNGFQFNANYTYSKALDETSDVFTQRAASTGIATPYFPANSYGPADFDLRHQATFTVNYQTHSEKHKLLLAGWGISPILTMHSGAPVYVYNSNSSYDPNKDGSTGVEKVVYIGKGSIKNALNHGPSPYGTDGVAGSGVIGKGLFANYTCPTNVNFGLYCDVPGDRQSLYGLRSYNLDAAISKHIAITERLKLTFQAAFFNVDGHVQWSQPDANLNDAATTFGRSTSTIPGTTREGQLSGRIEF